MRCPLKESKLYASISDTNLEIKENQKAIYSRGSDATHDGCVFVAATAPEILGISDPVR